MADAFPTQKVRRAGGIADADQRPLAKRLMASNRAGNRSAMAIQDIGTLQTALTQKIPQGITEPLTVPTLAVSWRQTADTDLQSPLIHRKYPAIAVMDPLAAEKKTEAVSPTG